MKDEAVKKQWSRSRALLEQPVAAAAAKSRRKPLAASGL
jgi:hypothetical protein